ncbi:RNA polymerase sigma-70 factor, ECF subfamily [Muriicola jejuensis]|nr:RNA polymerase sigma-70 factor, ECF subfamily [Muriicola jejuensis]
MIISLYDNPKAILKKAAKGNRAAQKQIYETHAPKMLSICRHYIRDLQFAEDVMITGFVKAFQHLHAFRNEGSFEGWLRRIMVREAITFLRKNQFVVYDSEVVENTMEEQIYQESRLGEEEAQELIDALPEGYKLVFVLYAFEGYKHKDIAELLKISENTSRSQLYRARQFLQDRIHNLEISKRAK